jgi:predicted 3-demethylubiquinone-9 3-methyltransferase (glyoxalase superfamily)
VQTIVPNLWFDDQAEDAANFYVRVFSNRKGAADRPESKILNISRYGEAGPRPAGMVLTVDFQLEGQRFTALNGGPEFTFDEAVSFLVNCEDQDEVDELWDALSADGGETSVCGWLKDKYGLSWQVIPTALERLIGDPDQEKAQRAMEAMLKMTKIDIAELEGAFAGD